MKQTQPNWKSTARAGSAAALALLACLALNPSASAKGKPGGGGGGGGGGSVPPPKEAPITYTSTQLRWSEDNDPAFGGLYVEMVNSQGLVTGWVQRPNGFIHGTVNLGPNGGATDTMVDLNDLFATDLATVALGWRIAYGRTITDDGLVGCELLPSDAPEKDTSTIPIALAVGDLYSGTLVLVDPGVADPKLVILETNRNGDLLVSRGVPYVENDYNRWGNILYTNMAEPGALPSYDPTPLLDVTEYRPSFNSALQVASVTYGKQFVQRRYDLVDPSTTIETWRSGRKERAYTAGIAEDGTTYVNQSPGALHRVTVSEAGEVVASPLTNESSWSPGYRNKVSRAEEPGEEEMVIQSSTDLEIFKPKYGRFPFPATIVGRLDNVNISPPHDLTSGQSYIGGYIVYEDVDTDNIRQSFILTPEGADVPTLVSEP